MATYDHLPQSVLKRLEAAIGYLDLSLPEEAWQEMDALPETEQERVEVLFARTDIRMKQQRWEEAAELADKICRLYPGENTAYINRSFCLHALGQTEEAKNKLLSAPPSIANVSTYHYNLACYYCRLGSLPEARAKLATAFNLQESLLDFASKDKDLESIWPELDHIYHHAQRTSPGMADSDLTNWINYLEHGTIDQRQEAMKRLVSAHEEIPLSKILSSPDPLAVQLATRGLWECWLNEAGASARHAMEEGIKNLNSGDLQEAEAIFDLLRHQHPEWPEATNKLATVYYFEGRYRESLDLCRQVTTVKPHHFGAWSGIAMCALQMELWNDALDAATHALNLLPGSTATQTMMGVIKAQIRRSGKQPD